MKRPILIAVAATFLLGDVGSWAVSEGEGGDTELALYITATAQAWEALRAGDKHKAIEKASECIERFQKPADTIQSILEQQKAVLPTGDVSSDERARIGRYQILNNVATCLLIRAWAEEGLGQEEQAVSDYAKVRKYTFARTSEKPGQPYWSAAEVAAQSLNRFPQRTR
jgi:hypothetical protein